MKRRRFFALALALVPGQALDASRASAQKQEATPTQETPADEKALNAVTQTVCRKQVVLLGEAPGHGAGHTIAFKAALVQRLIERCGFRMVLFESSRYEFIGFERAIRQHEATPEQLANAIGALWRYDREVDALIPFLLARAEKAKLRVGGLDPQIGGLGEPFTNQQIIPELSRLLPADRGEECRARFARHIDWSYPAYRPYGRVEHDALLACIGDMRNALKRDTADGRTLLERRAMLDNLCAMISADLGSATEKAQARERILYDNFRALADAGAPQGKIIVWGATVHLAKDSSAVANGPGLDSLGANIRRRYGSWSYSLGFSARSGNVRQFRKILPLDVCARPSLETAPPATGTQFLDFAKLRASGRTYSNALGFGCTAARWDRVLDGAVIFDTEWPAHNRRYDER